MESLSTELISIISKKYIEKGLDKLTSALSREKINNLERFQIMYNILNKDLFFLSSFKLISA